MRELPSRDASELDWLLFEQDGVIAARQATTVMPRALLRRLLASGRWTRPHRGVYLAHNGPVTYEQRVWIGLLAAGGGRPGTLAGESALVAHGLKGINQETVHVYVPANIRETDPPPHVRVHRTTTLTSIDRHRGIPPRTTPARSVADAAGWARSDDHARTIIAMAFQQGLVDLPAIEAVLTRLSRVRRRGLIAATARDAEGGSHSISELEFLTLCRRGELPTPTRQSMMTDSSGRRRYRDAHFVEWHLHVEIDGGQHTDVAAWWADMRRQNDMWISGDRVLRFPAWAIRNHQDEVIAQVRAALTAAGWDGRRKDLGN